MDFSVFLPILVSGVGLYLLIKLRFFFIFHPIRTGKVMLRTLKDKKSRRSLSLALAGTLGVGNIFGVTSGIMIGGAGSVFWMLVSSIFSMVIKYAECVLSQDMNTSDGGGMHRVIYRSFGKLGSFCAALYASLCTALALFMGSAMQSSAVAGVAEAALGAKPLFSAVILSVLLVLGVVRGVGRIEKITAKLIPLTTIFYIFLTFSIVLVNFREIPRVISDVMTSAFSAPALRGGICGFLTSNAVREGYARGILSNEAGVGTSSFAHTRADKRSAAECGVSGIIEVLFDTVILCMLTAAAVLSSSVTLSGNAPMAVVTEAVSTSLSHKFTIPLVLSILVFAYSTVICWYYYGTECVRYLVGKRAATVFSAAFVVFLLIGAIMTARPLVRTIDFILLVMCILTLSAILRQRKRIFFLSRDLIGGK